MINDIFTAARMGDASRVKALLDTDLTLRDSNGHTSLHVAAFHTDRTPSIELLLDYGAEVNGKTDDGVYAIEVAQERGHTAVTDLLRKHGAVS